MNSNLFFDGVHLDPSEFQNFCRRIFRGFSLAEFSANLTVATEDRLAGGGVVDQAINLGGQIGRRKIELDEFKFNKLFDSFISARIAVGAV